MWSTLKLSVKLLQNILAIKRIPSRYHISLLAASVMYSLYIMVILDQQKSGDVSEYLNRLKRVIFEWLVNYDVIGHYMFGGSHEHNWKGKTELEVK
jgi:type III secretory pathway component EscR